MPKRDISIETRDGSAPAGLFTPEGARPRGGVIIYMDAFGPRPGLDQMAERLAGHGYAVLVPDLYYRHGSYGGPFHAKTAWADEATGAKIRAMMAATTQAMTQQDTAAFLDALAENGAGGPAGTVGYCMGGARSLNSAAAHPERIKAAASFHGGNLASDAPDSPHRSAAAIKARVYVGTAGVDKGFPPEQAGRLAEALRTAEVDHVIENYVGMAHGWCVPDHTRLQRDWSRTALGPADHILRRNTGNLIGKV